MSELWTEILAACTTALHGSWLGAWLSFSHPLGMFLLGLIGGAVHCSAMCGPFVLLQVGNRLAAMPVTQATMLGRLTGMALLPYHAGRATTYSLLGAAAAGLAGGVQRLSVAGYLPAIGLTVAALALIVVSTRNLQPAAMGPRFMAGAGRWLDRVLPVLQRSGGIGNYLLGVALGFLPCGLLYSALLLAGASGDWQAGAVGMLLFTAGTVPGLLIVGIAGAAAAQRWRNGMRKLLFPAVVLNVLLLLLLAARSLQP